MHPSPATRRGSGLGPLARRVVDALSGRALRVAAGHLADVEGFEREEPARA